MDQTGKDHRMGPAHSQGTGSQEVTRTECGCEYVELVVVLGMFLQMGWWGLCWDWQSVREVLEVEVWWRALLVEDKQKETLHHLRG